MRRFFWLLIILFFSIWIGLKIAKDPGYALFAYQHWTVEMPLWFAIFIFFLILFLLYGILRFFDSIDFSLYRFKNWLRWRRKRYAYSKTNRGLMELIEGRWHRAEQDLLEGVSQSDAPLINYLAAAKAAEEQKAENRCDTYLQKAHQAAPHAEMAIGIAQAQLQINRGQSEQALAILKQLHYLAPKHPLVLKLLEKVYVRLGDWQSLLKLLPYFRKAKCLSEDYLNRLEENIYQALLRQSKNKNTLDDIHLTWKNIPKKFQQHLEFIRCYIQLLFSHPEATSEIEIILNKTLKKTWDKELVKLYGLLPAADPKKQLNNAEKWQKYYGNRAELLLTLGRLCIRCQLWGKARSFLTESLKLESLPETHAEYGKLLEKLGESNLAMQHFRKGLFMAAHVPYI